MADTENENRPAGRSSIFFKNVAVFLLSAAVVLGLLHYSKSTGAVVSTGGSRVLVAVHDLELGAVVSGADVAWRSARVPRGFAAVKFETTRQATMIGSIVVGAVRAGEFVPLAALAPAGDGFSIAAAIAAGRNAVTIPAGKIGSGVALLAVGDRVDVLLATDAQRVRAVAGKATSSEQLGSTLVVRDARVLNISVAARRDAARNAGRAVTLDLSLDEVQKVALALTAGTLHLALRSGNGTRNDGPRHMTTVSELLAPGMGAFLEPSNKTQVTVIQGRKIQSIEVTR